MKYICTDDIETLAAQGKKELVVDEHTVLMELARDLARQLGISIVDGSRPVPNSPAKAAPTPASVPPARSAPPASVARPKGCQHGPLTVTVRPEQVKNHPSADGVVDQLVELVRQTASKPLGHGASDKR